MSDELNKVYVPVLLEKEAADLMMNQHGYITVADIEANYGGDSEPQIEVSPGELDDFPFYVDDAPLTGKEVLTCNFEKLAYIIVYTGDDLVEINFPNLTQLTGGEGIGIDFYALPVVEIISFPLLETVGTDSIGISNNPALTTVSFPSLTTPPANLYGQDSALSEESVNAILIKLDEIGMTTGTIDISGGTSAAPTGDGEAAKDALILAGVTVTTN